MASHPRRLESLSIKLTFSWRRGTRFRTTSTIAGLRFGYFLNSVELSGLLAVSGMRAYSPSALTASFYKLQLPSREAELFKRIRLFHKIRLLWWLWNPTVDGDAEPRAKGFCI